MQVHRTIVHFLRKEYLTPNYLRVILKCDDIEQYQNTPLGVNNKLFIPPHGNPVVEMPIYNEETRRWDIENEDNRPTVRTYTHRKIDLIQKELTIDFVVHKGETIACEWAVNAKENDQIGLAMKLLHREIVPVVDHYLFITDMTGIPAVSALVETIPSSAKITVITEVLSDADILEDHYQTMANLTTHWLVNPNPENGSNVFDIAKPIIDALPESHFVHITAEFAVVKSLRDYLRKEKQWDSKEFYACAYWQIGKKEHEEREKRLD